VNRIPLLRHDMVYEQDVVLVRQRTRQLAAALGSGLQDQARLATAVSEIARNAFQYAGGGRVEFFVDGGPPAMMVVRVSDSGGGIARLDDVLAGRYVSPTGMGIGISGARRLSDLFEVKSAPDTGTAVTLGKELPERTRVTPAAVERVVATLARDAADDPLAELQEQNRELIRVLAALRESQAEQDRLARELAETNRGCSRCTPSSMNAPTTSSGPISSRRAFCRISTTRSARRSTPCATWRGSCSMATRARSADGSAKQSR
jgi:anti-sigma regulatory factor (Ser/Thr protein kinase)